MNNITKNYLDLVNALNTPEECNIEISKDNKYIIRIKIDGKSRYIGSKYSVEKDIQEFLNETGRIDDNTIIIVFGLGAGEHIRNLLCNLSNTNKVFIIEPCAAVIKEVIKLDEYANLLRDDRLALCYADDRIRKNLNDFIGEHNIDNIKIAVFANYNIIFDKEYELLKNEIESVKKNKKIGNNTLDTFSNLFFNNFIENIFALNEFYTVNYLKDKYKNKPAIIVSAGPSLNKNFYLLKEIQDKFIIITGPRTLGKLVQNGIRPDFLCEVDPQEEVYNFAKDYIDLEIPLVFMDSANSKLVKEQKGLKIIAANQGMENYLEEILGVKVDSIMQGGSVAHFCMGLAAYMGCSTVIFIGQDLAYTNERFQAEGTYAGEIDSLKYCYENNKEEWNRDINYNIYVNDIYGNKVRTSSILNSYREEFEDLIYSCNGIKFINSTEGGANIKGTELMNLKDSIRLYGIESLNKNLEELLGMKVSIVEETFINKMLKIIDKLEMIKKTCEEGIKYSNQMLHFYKDNKYHDLNKIFSQLDKIDEIINNKENLGFLAYRLFSAINNIMNNEYFKEKQNETEKEFGIRLAKRGFFIYHSVLQAIEDVIFNINNKFIYENNSNGLIKIFLEKNFIKEIKEISMRYDNLKEIDLVDNISLKDIRYKILNNGTFTFFHKPIHKITKDKFKLMYGNWKVDKNNVTVYSIKKDTKYFGTLNHSLVLIREEAINVKKEKTLYIKFKKNEKENIYLRFMDKEHLHIYKDINKGLKNFDDFKGIALSYFDLFFESNLFGYSLKESNYELFSTVLKKIEKNEIEIVIDFENGRICFQDQMFKINKYVMEKYVDGRYITICSFLSINDKSEYQIFDVETGNFNFEAPLIKNQVSIISDDNKLTLNNNKLKLNKSTKIYKIFSYN